MKVVNVPVGKLREATWNAHVVPPDTLERIKTSVQRWGIVENEVVRPNGDGFEVISGNHRLRIYQALGMTAVPCEVVDVDDANARLMAQTLNNTRGEDDLDKATALYQEIADLGIGAEEMASLLPEAEPLPGPGTEGLTDPDEVPPTPVVPGTRPGDLWLCGEHRVLCGDSLQGDAYEKLMAGARGDACITSPPYNVGIKYASHKDRAARKDYLGFVREVAERVFAALAPGRYLAWNIGVSPKTYPAHQVVTLEAAGFTFQRQIIWAKTGIPYPIFPSTLRVKRARHYKPNYVHEAIQVLKRGGASGEPRSTFCPLCEGGGEVELGIACAESHEAVELMTKGDEPELGGRVHPLRRYQNDVWRISQSAATANLRTVSRKSKGLQKGGQDSHTVKEHPAAYPAELPRALMGFLTAPGEGCLDPFLGSGTTLIACEQLGRRCYGIEIEPAYVDVAVRRWENFTGKSATVERA